MESGLIYSSILTSESVRDLSDTGAFMLTYLVTRAESYGHVDIVEAYLFGTVRGHERSVIDAQLEKMKSGSDPIIEINNNVIRLISYLKWNKGLYYKTAKPLLFLKFENYDITRETLEKYGLDKKDAAHEFSKISKTFSKHFENFSKFSKNFSKPPSSTNTNANIDTKAIAPVKKYSRIRNRKKDISETFSKHSENFSKTSQNFSESSQNVLKNSQNNLVLKNPRKPIKKALAEKPSMSDVLKCEESYKVLFAKSNNGTAPDINFGRDRKILSDLIKAHGAEEVQNRIGQFVRVPIDEHWYTKKSGGHSLPGLKVMWNWLVGLDQRGKPVDPDANVFDQAGATTEPLPFEPSPGSAASPDPE